MLLAFNSDFSWLLHRFPDSRKSRNFIPYLHCRPVEGDLCGIWSVVS